MKTTILPNGNLAIDLDDSDDRAEILEHMRGDQWTQLFEGLCANGWGCIAPEWIGALTDAPILTDDHTIEDDGTHTIHGRVWWFPNYAVEDPIETLCARGRVVFTKAPE